MSEVSLGFCTTECKNDPSPGWELGVCQSMLSPTVQVQCPQSILLCSTVCELELVTHVLMFPHVILNLLFLSLSWQIFIGEISMYFIKSTRETLIIQEKTILTGECCYLNPLLRRIIRFIGKHPVHFKLGPCLYQTSMKHPDKRHHKIN